MLVRVEAPPRDLSPTYAVNHLLAILRDMLSTASMNEGREYDMNKVNVRLALEFYVISYSIFCNHLHQPFKKNNTVGRETNAIN